MFPQLSHVRNGTGKAGNFQVCGLSNFPTQWEKGSQFTETEYSMRDEEFNFISV